MAELPSVEGVFDLRSPLFSRDFVIVDLLPGITLVASLTCLFLAGAPGEAPNGVNFTQGLSEVTGTSLLLGIVASVVIGVSVHPFAPRLRRWLSGQWTNPVVKPVATLGYNLSVNRRRRARNRLNGTVKVGPSALSRWIEIYRRELPDPPFTAPTRLGNAFQALRKPVADTESHEIVQQSTNQPLDPSDSEIYRAAYRHAKGRRLEILAVVDDARLKIAAAERYTLVWFLVAVGYAWLLRHHGAWLLLSVAALGLSRLSYLGAVQCVVDYNHLLGDLFREIKASSSKSDPSTPATSPQESAE